MEGKEGGREEGKPLGPSSEEIHPNYSFEQSQF
jgi:hypothetical protein